MIKDERFVRLCSTVMEHEATMKPPEFDREWIEDEQWKDTEFLSGLPLGFVTSQWFTQLNYKELDHKIVEEWKELGGVDIQFDTRTTLLRSEETKRNFTD